MGVIETWTALHRHKELKFKLWLRFSKKKWKSTVGFLILVTDAVFRDNHTHHTRGDNFRRTMAIAIPDKAPEEAKKMEPISDFEVFVS